MPTRKMQGFSLIEMMIVVAIALIMMAITFITFQPASQDARINGAYDSVLTQLRIARERAIAERTRYIVSFGATVPPAGVFGTVPRAVPPPDPKSIQLWVWRTGVPVGPPPVSVNSFELPFDVQFQAVAGLPNPGPDNWGTGARAIDFNQGVGLGGLTYVMFMPDGSSQDELGNSNSGVVYIARAGVLSSSRAVTVFGTTGRVRGWRLNGAAWVEQ
jgi:prepilin-type N-terminal cleavage/methylation domain-containing protein